MKINKPYVIAEIGLNYDGKIAKALEMIRLAKESGANAAKFQTLSIKDLVNPLNFLDNGESSPNPFYNQLLEYELSLEDHQKISQYCKQIEIDFISSAFDLQSLKVVGTYCDYIKIASSELNNIPLLLECGKYHKPVFIAMGMGTIKETLQAIDALKKGGVETVFVLYCVSLYPLPYDRANLKVLKTLQKETGLTVGFSDHSLDDSLAIASIALGGMIIEKHVTIKREDRLFDHSFSMEFGELSSLIKKVNHVYLGLGDGNQTIQDEEAVVRSGSRRSFFSKKDINEGEELIIGENIHAVRPLVGISLEESNVLEGKKAKLFIKAHHPIFFRDIRQ